MTSKFQPIISSLMGIMERPDAERPYRSLAKAYLEAGMPKEADAVLFLVTKRFGKDDDICADSHEEQRKNDI